MSRTLTISIYQTAQAAGGRGGPADSAGELIIRVDQIAAVINMQPGDRENVPQLITTWGQHYWIDVEDVARVKAAWTQEPRS
jgi:hypothetical protein